LPRFLPDGFGLRVDFACGCCVLGGSEKCCGGLPIVELAALRNPRARRFFLDTIFRG